MEIRTCRQCKEYKYISEDGLCRDCIEPDNGDYCIIVHYGLMPTVYKSGLTKEEAKEEVEDKPSYFGIHKE